MSRAREVVHSRSLRQQVAGLERQLVLRRQRLRNVAARIGRKTASRMVSPGVLLLAVGVGVALEQSSHRRGWSLPNLLDATDAGLRLLLTFSSSVRHSPGETTPSVWQRTDYPPGPV
jgi:hypothetical protein